MYVWQRGGRFTFQKRVPSDLVGLLGPAPIRFPANRAMVRRFAKLSDRKAGDENAKLKKPYPTLSDTTICRQYALPLALDIGALQLTRRPGPITVFRWSAPTAPWWLLRH